MRQSLLSKYFFVLLAIVTAVLASASFLTSEPYTKLKEKNFELVEDQLNKQDVNLIAGGSDDKKPRISLSCISGLLQFIKVELLQNIVHILPSRIISFQVAVGVPLYIFYSSLKISI